MKTTEFKKGSLIFSGTCKDVENLKELLSEKIYYNSKLNLTMFCENRGIKYFYLVNFKGEIKQDKIVKLDAKNKFQYRYFLKN